MLNPQQFRVEELQMFMPMTKVIHDVYKGAAHGRGSPREQWEDAPHTRIARLKYGKQSLQSQSMEDPEGNMAQAVAQGNVRPLTITHGGSTGLPDVLSDGHRRLAQLEARGHTEVPVIHQYLDDL